MMTKKELFAGWNERMFLDDPAAVAAYCRKYWPEECSQDVYKRQVLNRYVHYIK